MWNLQSFLQCVTFLSILHFQFCEHVDTTCSKINTCKTCDTFGGMGGQCTEIDIMPVSTSVYNTQAILYPRHYVLLTFGVSSIICRTQRSLNMVPTAIWGILLASSTRFKVKFTLVVLLRQVSTRNLLSNTQEDELMILIFGTWWWIILWAS